MNSREAFLRVRRPREHLLAEHGTTRALGVPDVKDDARERPPFRPLDTAPALIEDARAVLDWIVRVAPWATPRQRMEIQAALAYLRNAIQGVEDLVTEAARRTLEEINKPRKRAERNTRVTEAP